MFEIMPKLLALEWGAELKRVKPPIFFVEQRGNNFSVQLVFARAIGDAIQLVDSILDADWTCVILPEKKGNNVVMCKTSQICEITLGKSANIHELAAIIKRCDNPFNFLLDYPAPLEHYLHLHIINRCFHFQKTFRFSI